MEQNVLSLKEFDKFELDRDIPQHLWNSFMKQYSSKYLTFKDKDDCTKIRCRYGTIEPYSIKKDYLMFYGLFPSSRKKTMFAKKIKNLSLCVTSEGYNEIIVKFETSTITLYENLFFIKKRMKLSDEERQRRVLQMSEYRKNVRNTKI